MSSRQTEKPGRVMERTDRNSHAGVAIFLAHAEKDDPRQQLLPEDRSELLEQAEYCRLSGSSRGQVSSQKTNLGENEKIDARAPWSPDNLSSKASKERHAYIKPKMEQVLSCPDAFRVSPRPPRPPPPPPGNPPIDAHWNATWKYRCTSTSADSPNALSRSPRESLSESNYGGAPIMWRPRSPGTSSYNSTSSDDDNDDDDDSSKPPRPSRPAPLQSQSGGNPPTTSRPRGAARGQLRRDYHVGDSSPIIDRTESYRSIHSYSTASTVATPSFRSRLSSSAAPHSSHSSQLTMSTVATLASQVYSPDTPNNIATSSPRSRHLSSSTAPRYSVSSQLTMATVATSAPEEYSPDSMVSSHLSSHSPQAPMPSSYHAAAQSPAANDQRHTQTSGGRA
ncbi:hypothetical protein CPB85DRAFT_1437637 [Mucidula mucida]|nr:hypothetical protein CPB85DRAFT_1437637 [Mucidula mucida]